VLCVSLAADLTRIWLLIIPNLTHILNIGILKEACM